MRCASCRASNPRASAGPASRLRSSCVEPIEPRAGADGRPAHQSRHDRHRGDPERRARVRRARGDRQGPALDAVRLGRDRRRHQHHHARRRGRQQRAGGLRQLRHEDRELQRRFGDDETGATIAGAWFDSEGFPTRAGDDTDRGTENTSFTASAHASVGAVTWACGAGTPRAPPSTRISSLAPVDQDFENMRSR